MFFMDDLDLAYAKSQLFSLPGFVKSFSSRVFGGTQLAMVLN
jgi:hypothetical protein